MRLPCPWLHSGPYQRDPSLQPLAYAFSALPTERQPVWGSASMAMTATLLAPASSIILPHYDAALSGPMPLALDVVAEVFGLWDAAGL